MRSAHGKRPEGVPGERPDKIIQIRRLDDGSRRGHVAPSQALSAGNRAL